jgi:hypothetical protein
MAYPIYAPSSYRVRGWTGLGYSGYSAAVSAVTYPGPGTPSNLVAEILPWGPDPHLVWTGGANVLGYQIERSDDGVSGWTVLQTQYGVVGTSAYDGTAVRGQTYFYRVCAFDAFTPPSYSAYSNVASVTVPAYAPPVAPAVAASGAWRSFGQQPILADAREAGLLT